MSKHYMLKLVRNDYGSHSERHIPFPEYIASDLDKCVERFHKYAAEIGFTDVTESASYQGGTVYRNPKDKTEILRLR